MKRISNSWRWGKGDCQHRDWHKQNGKVQVFGEKVSALGSVIVFSMTIQIMGHVITFPKVMIFEKKPLRKH